MQRANPVHRGMTLLNPTRNQSDPGSSPVAPCYSHPMPVAPGSDLCCGEAAYSTVFSFCFRLPQKRLLSANHISRLALCACPDAFLSACAPLFGDRVLLRQSPKALERPAERWRRPKPGDQPRCYEDETKASARMRREGKRAVQQAGTATSACLRSGVGWGDLRGGTARRTERSSESAPDRAALAGYLTGSGPGAVREEGVMCATPQIGGTSGG